MPINQLIAQGGTQIRSPVQRYMETRKQMEGEKRNQLAMQAQRQSMNIRRQQMGLQQQKQQAEQRKIWGARMAPFMREVSNLPETERQTHWSALIPDIEKMAIDSEMPVDFNGMKTWDQRKANFIMDANPVASPDRLTKLDRAETVTQDWDSRLGKYNEVGRGIRSQATGPYNSFGASTKGTVTDLQKQLTKNLLSKDKITTGVNFIMDNQQLFDLGSKMSAGVGNAMQFIGIDAPDFLKKEVSDMADLKTYTLNIANGIRKESTGAASSFKELDKFIYPLVSVATDGKTRAIKRMQSLVQFNELTTVRLKNLLADGYQVVSRQGDKTMRVESPDGKVIAVDKAFPLSSIPSYKKRKGDLLKIMAQGKKPSEFSEQQRSDMFNEVQNELSREGYNTDVFRTGWGR